jgi:hypothetical protein
MVLIYPLILAVLSTELNLPMKVPSSGIFRSGRKIAVSGSRFFDMQVKLESSVV